MPTLQTPAAGRFARISGIGGGEAGIRRDPLRIAARSRGNTDSSAQTVSTLVITNSGASPVFWPLLAVRAVITPDSGALTV